MPNAKPKPKPKPKPKRLCEYKFPYAVPNDSCTMLAQRGDVYCATHRALEDQLEVRLAADRRRQERIAVLGRCEYRSGPDRWQCPDARQELSEFCEMHERWAVKRRAKALLKKTELRESYLSEFGPSPPDTMVEIAERVLRWAPHLPGCGVEQETNCDCGWFELYTEFAAAKRQLLAETTEDF